jgi:hypothetical protein
LNCCWPRKGPAQTQDFLKLGLAEPLVFLDKFLVKHVYLSLLGSKRFESNGEYAFVNFGLAGEIASKGQSLKVAIVISLLELAHLIKIKYYKL